MSYMGGPGRPERIQPTHADWLMERLSPRDWLVLRDMNRLRLMGSGHIERVYFDDVAESARGRSRRRSLARLVDWQVLTTLERRIGGVRAGSAGLVFALDSGGQRVLQAAIDDDGDVAGAEAREGHRPRRVRRPGVPTELFVRHTLAVSELYVQLFEAVRLASGVRLVAFEAEPGSWWPNGLGGWLKPDAYAALEYGEVIDHWWVEVDRATESLPVIQKKLRGYVEFANRREAGPGGVVPRVVVTVPDERRAVAVRAVADQQPPPASALLGVVEYEDAAAFMTDSLLSV